MHILIFLFYSIVLSSIYSEVYATESGYETAYCTSLRDITYDDKAMMKRNSNTLACCSQAKLDCGVFHPMGFSGPSPRVNLCLDSSNQRNYDHDEDSDHYKGVALIKECCKKFGYDVMGSFMVAEAISKDKCQ